MILNVHHLVAFLIRSQSSQHWRNTLRKKLMLQKCKGILKQVASSRKAENLWTTISWVLLKRLKTLNFGSPRLGKLFFIITYSENLMCLAWVVKKFEFWITPFRGTRILVPPNFVKFYLSFIFAFLKNFMCLAWKVKKFEIWMAHLRRKPSLWAPIFVRFSLFLISAYSENLIQLVRTVKKF